jgi:Family of unknown function (DUF7002)
MTIEELTTHYPRAFHMAEFGTWDSISRHGLLSTSALLDLYGVTGDRRVQLESRHRSRCETITHPLYGSAVIRDQKVLSESALRKCLSGATPQQWYELLNKKTFFWLHPNRLVRLLKGRQYRGRRHCVISVPTDQLLQKHGERITLCPINSGSTIYRPVERSPSIFYRVSDFPFQERRLGRPIENTIVELAVEYSVANITDIAILVEHWHGEKIIETVWVQKDHRC